MLNYFTYRIYIFFLIISAVNQLAYNRLASLCNKLEVDDVLVSVNVIPQAIAGDELWLDVKVVQSTPDNSNLQGNQKCFEVSQVENKWPEIWKMVFTEFLFIRCTF